MISKEELEARKDAERLLKRMQGSGWEVKVWESAGWHYAVTTGALTVHVWEPASSKMSVAYSASLSDDYSNADLDIWSDYNLSEDPNVVVRAKLRKAKETLENLDKIVTETEHLIYGG